MNKIEFSDINKFLTSLGLILLLAAILLPWFITQNSDLILVEQEAIDKSSETAKELITEHQTYLLFLSRNLIALVITFIVLGLTSFTIGICRWKNRQKVIDDIQDQELEAKKRENIGKLEKKRIIESEIDPETENKSEVVTKYINLENLIYFKLAPYYTVNYVTKQNLRIGKFEYDIILESKYLEKRGDLILEIKYYNKRPSLNQLTELANNFLFSVNHYEQTQQRQVTPVIIVIVADNSMPEQNLKDELQKYVDSVRNNLRVNFFTESVISNVETPEIIAGK